MYRYILKRLLLLIPVIIGASLIIFFIINIAPGDITTIKGDGASEEALEELKEKYGLNDPLIVQYGRYMLNLLHGDLGNSYYTNNSVLSEFFSKFPNTLQLAVWSMLLGIAIALPVGIISAIKQYSLLDNCSMLVALAGVSMPVFWEGLLLIILFSNCLGWFPSGGNTLPFSLVLPVVTSGTHMAATVTRMTRSSMLEVIGQDYVRTARANGIPRPRIIFKHALKNALIPVVTYIGPMVAGLLTGSFVTEKIFALPGMGKYFVESIGNRDYTVIMGTTIFFAVFYVIMVFLVDIAYALIDPRIRLQ